MSGRARIYCVRILWFSHERCVGSQTLHMISVGRDVHAVSEQYFVFRHESAKPRSSRLAYICVCARVFRFRFSGVLKTARENVQNCHLPGGLFGFISPAYTFTSPRSKDVAVGRREVLRAAHKRFCKNCFLVVLDGNEGYRRDARACFESYASRVERRKLRPERGCWWWPSS